jgi:hypothetical protein
MKLMIAIHQPNRREKNPDVPMINRGPRCRLENGISIQTKEIEGVPIKMQQSKEKEDGTLKLCCVFKTAQD